MKWTKAEEVNNSMQMRTCVFTCGEEQQRICLRTQNRKGRKFWWYRKEKLKSIYFIFETMNNLSVVSVRLNLKTHWENVLVKNISYAIFLWAKNKWTAFIKCSHPLMSYKQILIICFHQCWTVPDFPLHFEIGWGTNSPCGSDSFFEGRNPRNWQLLREMVSLSPAGQKHFLPSMRYNFHGNDYNTLPFPRGGKCHPPLTITDLLIEKPCCVFFLNPWETNIAEFLSLCYVLHYC